MSHTLHTLFPEQAGIWPDLPVAGFAIDSRAIVPGSVFVALKGQNAHGISFAAQAAAAGAVCILAEGPVAAPACGVPVFDHPDLRVALGQALARFHGLDARRPVLFGVTGTNGKTSTVQLLAGALAQLGHRAGTIGTLGTGMVGALVAGERTTPDVVATHATLAALRDAGATHVAMEVSSHALDQQRVAGLSFAHAAFSNLTHDHLDYHGDMRSYGAAKARLFRWPGLRTAVINVDDAFGQELAAGMPATIRVIRTSSRIRADLFAQDIVADGHGLRFDLCAGEVRAHVETRLLGHFNVDNLLLVAGLLQAEGVAITDIAALFARAEPVPGRMNRVDVRDGQALVVVDYAHTPDGLEQALVTLRGHCAGSLIVVFGCGGDRDAAKRGPMGAIAARLADQLFVTDDNPRTEDGDAIVAAIVAGATGAKSLRVERDRRQAIRAAIAVARPGDVVLIAGKGHEAYQEQMGRKTPFDDRIEAELALREAA